MIAQFPIDNSSPQSNGILYEVLVNKIQPYVFLDSKKSIVFLWSFYLKLVNFRQFSSTWL